MQSLSFTMFPTQSYSLLSSEFVRAVTATASEAGKVSSSPSSRTFSRRCRSFCFFSMSGFGCPLPLRAEPSRRIHRDSDRAFSANDKTSSFVTLGGDLGGVPLRQVNPPSVLVWFCRRRQHKIHECLIKIKAAAQRVCSLHTTLCRGKIGEAR